MKKIIAIILINLILLSGISVAAQTEGGYTHLPVSVSGNSKLFLHLGEFDTSYVNFIDYMAYGSTAKLTDTSEYNKPHALFYTRDESKKNSSVLYLDSENIWNVNGFDFVLEPGNKIIKVVKYTSVNLTDKEIQDKVKGLEKVIVDVQDGYYKTLNLLICQPSGDEGVLNVTVEYDDLSTEDIPISVMKKPYDATTASDGYIVTKSANGDENQAAKRFQRYTVPCYEDKAVTRITYSASTTWRDFYIISQMAENASFSVHLKDAENLIDSLSEDEISLKDMLNYKKASFKISTLITQFGIKVENYDKFLNLSSIYEERLKDTSAYDIFVSKDGSKNSKGTKNAPLDSIESARDLIEEASRWGINNAPVNVMIRGGMYFLDESIVFEEKHSGTENAPITYKAYNGEEVVFTTADKLNTKNFKPVTDDTILNKLPAHTAKYVKQINLNIEGIENPGQFLPNAELVETEDVLVISNNRQQPVAQYPNGDMNMTMGLSVYNAGETREETLTNSGGGSFEITKEQAERWKDLESMESYVYGAFFEPWMPERILVDSISTENNSLNLYSGSYDYIKASNWGGLRYKLMHALCELDAPGEWYIDRKENILYYYPDEEDAEMYIATKTFNAVTLKKTSFIDFEGITFKNIRGDAIYASDGIKDIKITDCTFENIGENGIEVKELKDSKAVGYDVNSSYNLKIENNIFTNIGSYAYLNNGTGHSGTLTPSGNIFKNNYVYNCSNLMNYYMVRINKAVGDKVENNFMHKSELGGFTFTGNDMFVGYNEVYNVGQNGADCAAIYTGRSYVRTNNEIAYNYVHDCAPLFPQLLNHHRGIYLDDGTSGQYVHSNIANNVTYMTSASGKKNRIMNNIILGESKSPIRLSVSEYLTDSQMLNPLEKARNLEEYGEIWLEKYEWLDEIDKWTDYNNQISGNITQLAIYYEDEWLNYNNAEEDIKNNTVIGAGNYEPFVDPGNHDFRVKKDSKILTTNPDVLNENNFSSMDLIGIDKHMVSKLKEQFDKEKASFDILMPKRNSSVSSTENVFFMWQTANHADEYDFKLYKADDLTNPIYKTTTGTNFVELADFPFENTEYVWTVTARIDSLKLRGEWESKVKYNLFKVTDITVNEDVYEYIDLREYNNAVAFVSLDQKDAERKEDGRYVYQTSWALNLGKMKSHLDGRNMVKAGDIYYRLNQLDDKYKGILNYNNEVTIDIPDKKYEKIYILAESNSHAIPSKHIKVKYSDGEVEELCLGEQVRYGTAENAYGEILPQVYTGAIWIEKEGFEGVVRGDWFTAAAYSHSVTPDKDRVVTDIIIPSYASLGESYTLYGITCKVAIDGFEIGNLSDESKEIDVLTLQNNKPLNIEKIYLKENETLVEDVTLLEGINQLLFWNLDKLKPYSTDFMIKK